MGKTKEKTWMLIIETKSYRGLTCYRKVLFDSATDHQVAKEKELDKKAKNMAHTLEDGIKSAGESRENLFKN